MSNGFNNSNVGSPNVRTSPPTRRPSPSQTPPRSYTARPSKGYIPLIIIGVIIVLIGCIIWTSSGFMSPPNQYDDKYQDETEYGGSQTSDKYYKDRTDYSNNVRIISTIGNIIQTIGLILIALALALGGIKDTDLTANVRLGMIIAMGLIIAFKITTFVSISSLSSMYF